MTSAEAYFEAAKSLLSEIERREVENIRQVAALMKRSILDDGIPHIFGSGHSRIAAKEVFIRAGTLSCLRAMEVNADLDRFERIEGVADALLRDYALQPNDMLIVISNSGINPLPVEMALGARSRGLSTAALTSLEHSQAVESRHSSGKKLYEVVDVVVNTGVPAGDAALSVPQLPMNIGPLSTLAGVAIMNAVVVETIVQILEEGETPPVRISRNMPGGDEHNRAFKEKYGARIPEL